MKRGMRENKNEEENATEILTQKMTSAERRQRMKINYEEGRCILWNYLRESNQIKSNAQESNNRICHCQCQFQFQSYCLSAKFSVTQSVTKSARRTISLRFLEFCIFIVAIVSQQKC